MATDADGGAGVSAAGGDPLLERALATLRAHQPEARAQGIELIGVVGSVARGHARPESDIDIVYDVIARTTYFRIGTIAAALEDALGRSIDMIDRRAMKPERWAFMGQDLATI
ncbi:MAG: hypothetical protein EON88_20980 [Brevundimonas sp.]|nr:MAG: hypothetical protein EON88_20980 [Brevundimonas sp.]